LAELFLGDQQVDQIKSSIGFVIEAFDEIFGESPSTNP
jgi:hypothetical protein